MTTAPVAGREALDPVTLAVLRSALLHAVDEMKGVVLRTAYSNLWKEAGDLSCGILTGDGDLVAPGRGDIPVHLVTMPSSLQGCLARIPADSLQPGDVLYQNDPYQGNNHLPDFIMAKPVFYDGAIVAYAAVRGHYVDIGGSTPGSYSAATNDIYSEGLRVPPVRIYEAGELNQDVVDILLANTRNSRERLGDLRAQYAGCVNAERRIITLCEQYGADALRGAMEMILDASEAITRRAIAEIPDGVYEFEDFCDGDGLTSELIRIAVKVTVSGDELHVDFTGSSPQVRGGMNAPIAVTKSAVCYATKALTDPDEPQTSGSYRPVTIHAPLGSVVNPRPPAPVVAANHETASRIADAVIGALAPAVPERVAAAGSGTSGVIALGVRIEHEDAPPEESILVETHGVGHGAHDGADGANARRVGVGNTGNTPTEALEASFPITTLEYSLTPDGGGAGRYRGGTGLYRRMRLDHDATVTLCADRAAVAPYGLFGGLPARAAHFWVERPDGTTEVLDSKTPGLEMPAGTLIHFQCAGGGGYGPPAERDLAALQDDLDDGYVTPEGAREHYGVRLRRDDSRPDGVWVVDGRA
jgi:N-methylhydantoinase B